MFKRILLVLVLVVFGLTWVAASPPDTGSDQPDHYRLPPDDPDDPDGGEGDDTAAQSSIACVVTRYTPYKTHLDVNARATNVCVGPGIAFVRLEMKLKRHRFLWHWATIKSYDSGWELKTSQDETIYAACEPGTHTYKLWAKGSVMDVNGATGSKAGDSRSKTITCVP